MMMKLALLLVLVIAFVTCQAADNKGMSYHRCLYKCKKTLQEHDVPTKCFDQCQKPYKPKKKKTIACSIPIYKLGCRDAPIAQSNTTLNDEEMSDQMDAPVNTESLWRAYHAELIKFITKGQNAASAQNFAGLQLVSMPFPAEWDNDDRQFQIIANRRAKFQMTYETQLGFFDANYCDEFVPNLDFGLGANPAQEQLIKDLYSQQDSLTQQLLTEEIKCEDRYFALNPVIRNSRYPTFNDYATKSCATLKLLNAQVTAVKGQIEHSYSQFAGGRKELEARAAVLKCRGKERKFFELNPLRDFMANINGGRMSPFSIELNQYSYSSSAQSSYRSMGLTLFVVNFSMNRAMRKLTTALKDFRLKISAKGFAAINVAPEPSWFNGDAITTWRNGPFRNGKTTGSFFGENGSISLLPRTFYTVYQPTVEFSLNDKDTEEFEKQSSFSVSLTIYYVSFSFGQSRKISKFKESENLYRIKIEDNSPTPQVIAVNNIVL